MSNTKFSRKQGFTLVELSIVIIIIGFLIAGISAGTSLIRQAGLSSVITDLTNYKMAVNMFKDKYGGLPGDLSNAYAWFGSGCGANTSGAASSCNGNGDGLINLAAPWISELPYEELKAWQHLALAGMIQGNYTGTPTGGTNGTERESAGFNVPASKIQGGGFTFSLDDPKSYYGVSVAGKNLITLGSLSGAAFTNVYLDGIVSPADGQSLDNKMDDGNNLSGNILIVGAHVDWGTAGMCTDDAWRDGTSGQLNFANDGKTCRIVLVSDDLQP